MSKLREIKRRIRSVNNISQVTNAMQMVAASRMRTAQDNAEKGKLFTERIRELLVRLIANQSSTADHPLLDLTYSETNEVLFIVFSTQRGLAGSLPSSLLRFTQKQVQAVESQGKSAKVVTIGNKISEQLSRRNVTVIADFSDMPESPTTADIRPLIRLITDSYLNTEVGRVVVIYPKFINAMTQEPVAEDLLPLDPEDFVTDAEDHISGGFIYEPSPSEILDAIIPRYLETQIYQARLETVASEYSARMVAMKNATDNANDVKSDLTLQYNKSRQAQITAEIAEITSGRIGAS